MTKTFLFESDHFTSTDGEYCAQIEVELELNATSANNCDYFIASIFDHDSQVERKLSSFPIKEQETILEKCNDLVDAWAYDAWCDKLEYLAEKQYEYSREN
jgi:hypothetical protein